ncbi:hypothetical protein IMZ28_08105 [Sulfurovum indicum]|uniref:Uncharacterized protein n=2 Tax=Sulfurovum TaxID=265570 RepID=A0A7M1S2G6_9BACT|nr:hypothetical protein [Sulfurovum indicum]QOR61404.1 hypothetical protein IMZ28_08105 [Sulfurovum indicum]
MKQKLQKIQERMVHDPKLKKAVDSIRPKRTLWGVVGIILFFFVPELITYIWQPELTAWAHTHSITEPLAMQRMLYAQLEKMFADGVSWLNIGIGVVFLFWVWRSKA